MSEPFAKWEATCAIALIITLYVLFLVACVLGIIREEAWR